MSQLRMDVGLEDHVQGPGDAPITLVEYGDYECPSCGAAFPEVKQLQRTLGHRVRFVFRHFPLSQVHPHALPAAEATEAAGAQGQFWEMHDLLFEHQQDLRIPALLSYARALELDLARFTDELAQHRFLKKVRRDFMSGARSGVNGTPTFFINGFRYQGPYRAEAILAAISGGPSAFAP
jgi:protein-disulfide isomerase